VQFADLSGTYSPTNEAEWRVEVAERYADGLASRDEMAAVEQAASVARDLAVGPESNAPRRHRSRIGRCTSWAAYDLTNVPDRDVCEVVWNDVEDAAGYALDAQRGKCREHNRLGAALLRDIFGNPFRPVTTNPAWLTPKRRRPRPDDLP